MSPFAQDVESLKLAPCGWLAGESSRERQFVSPAPWRPAARPVPSTTTACPSRVKGRSMRAPVSASSRWTEVPTARGLVRRDPLPKDLVQDPALAHVFEI